jgi:hypothetical protein
LLRAYSGKASVLVQHASAERSWSGARRVVYRACYLVLLVSGRAAARLAGAFRALAVAGDLGPLRVLMQLPVLACWLFVRPISLAAFAACSALAAPTSPARTGSARRS